MTSVAGTGTGTGTGTVQKRENNEIQRWTDRKKMEQGICYYPRSWADIPEELLDIISENLNIVDYISLGSVCRSWRLFYSENKRRFMASQSPLVIYISRQSSQDCCFYDIVRYKSDRYKIKLPNFASKFDFCIGVSSGYLIMKDTFTRFFLVINPVTGHQLQFSCMLHPPNCYRNDRAIFASIGSQDQGPENQDFLIVIHAMEQGKLEYCRSRDNLWKEYSYVKKDWLILDIAVFDGRIFAITSDSQIGILKVTSSDLIFLELKSKPRLSSFARFVACKEQLLIVDFTFFDFDYMPPVKVYRINFSEMKWALVNNLGENALFLSNDNMMLSKLIKPTKWGGPSNRIYHLVSCSDCDQFSVNGEFLGGLDVVHREEFCPGTYSWYFLEQSYCIDNVRDDY